MVVTELLKVAGLGGSIVMVVSAGIALYHGRSLMRAAAVFGTWFRWGRFDEPRCPSR